MNRFPVKALVFLLGFLSAAFCRAEEASRLVANLKAGKSQTVVAYGTSLTERGAWVGHLKEALDKQYPALATVINSGGSGQWSEWGVKHLDERVIDKKPDTVFIEFSINDSVARFNGSVEIAKSNLTNMIDRTLKANPDCEIILMTMTPGNKPPEGHRSHRKDIATHYEMYRNVAKERGLRLIDHYPNWVDLQKNDPDSFEKYVPDSIHPTTEGCVKVVTPVILQALGIKEN